MLLFCLLSKEVMRREVVSEANGQGRVRRMRQEWAEEGMPVPTVFKRKEDPEGSMRGTRVLLWGFARLWL